MDIEQKYINRFHERYEIVTETGCWIWTCCLDISGYGYLSANGVGGNKAHRLSYEIHKGEIPKGMVVMHKCDVPCCVNPDHLRVGTHQDNVADKVNKNRQAKGISHGSSKLTEEQVLDIRTKRLSKEEFSKLYNVSRITVNDIQRYRSWKHLL